MIKDNRFVNIIFNQEAAPVKRITHSDGREYLIVPSVAVVEGVMNNLLYTEEEMTVYIDAWNGRPLVIAHPQDLDGEYVSANSPERFARSPGWFFNAHFEEGRLKGDWWLDVAKVKAMGGQAEGLLTGLEAGQLFEQSTGLFTDVEESAGTFNEVPYEGIARNIRPDHIAILLDEVGACSVADGCGAPRVNIEVESTPGVTTELVSSEEDEEAALWRFLRPLTNLLKKVDDSVEVSIDVQSNADTEEGEQPETDSAEVNDRNESEVNMSREELIEGLLGMETGLLTRAMLEAADDETLAALWAQFAAMPEGEPEAAQGDDEEEEEPIHPQAEGEGEGEDEGGSILNLPPMLTEMMSMVGEFGGVSAVREALMQSKTQVDAQLDEMIGAITANSDRFSQEELRALPQPVLKKLVGLTRSAATVPNFSARGMGVNFQSEDEWEDWTPKEIN